MDDLESLFPKHEIVLHITHNQHRVYYETIEQYEAGREYVGDWATPEERAKAIATDSLWQLQWYSRTPVGFNEVWASTLEAALEAARG